MPPLKTLDLGNPPLTEPTNPWDGCERCELAIRLIEPLAGADLGVRKLATAAIATIRVMQDELDATAQAESEVFEPELTTEE